MGGKKKSPDLAGLIYRMVMCLFRTITKTVRLLVAGCIEGRYVHPSHIERLPSLPPANLSTTLELCPDSIPNKQGYDVGPKGQEDMLSIAIKITLDPDPRKHIKVSCYAPSNCCLVGSALDFEPGDPNLIPSMFVDHYALFS